MLQFQFNVITSSKHYFSNVVIQGTLNVMLLNVRKRQEIPYNIS